jgi:CheY-like chemotaxis protein
MSTNPFGDDRIIFNDDSNTPPRKSEPPWRVLIADDDPVVHQSTRLALRDVEIEGRPVELLQANSASEARAVLHADRNIDLVLLDVVMETEDAGLRLISALREEPGYKDLRIVIRTGQAGHAREDEIRARDDIDGYLHKAQQTRAWLVAILSELLGSIGPRGAPPAPAPD